MNKKSMSMTYILLIILLLVICIFLVSNQSSLKNDLNRAQKECAFNKKQIEMIYYVSENAEGIKIYSDKVLNDPSVLTDYNEMKENGLEHFLEKDNTSDSRTDISMPNESTIYYLYSYDGIETSEHQIYSFYYISEICGENTNTINTEECIKITDNIYIKPYETFYAGLV